MKTTLDIPDMLYRQVKAKSAMEGQSVRLVAINLFSAWVHAAPSVKSKKGSTLPGKAEALPSWFGIVRPYAEKVKRHDMDAVRESIARGRGEA